MIKSTNNEFATLPNKTAFYLLKSDNEPINNWISMFNLSGAFKSNNKHEQFDRLRS